MLKGKGDEQALMKMEIPLTTEIHWQDLATVYDHQ
jgi:hypothetical protein